MEMNIDLEGGNGMSFSQQQQPQQQQQTEEIGENRQMNVGRNVLEELKAERNALDPSFLHCIRLLDKEIKTHSSGTDSSVKQTEKIYVPMQEQRKYNLVGRLLGPKGMTLKRIQSDTQTKMSILGRTSMKDKQKEEELRSSDDPAHQHLKDDLHVLIEAQPPFSSQKLLAGMAEVRKMLIPPEPGQPDFSSKFDHPGQLLPPPSLMRGPPMMRGRMRGGGGGSRGGKPGFGGGGRGRRGGGGGGRGRGGGGGRGRGGGGSQMNDSRFGGSSSRDQPSMESWRDSAITKDYNHGASGGGDSDYGSGRGSSTNESFTSSEPYYSSFSDQGGVGGGSSGVGYGGGAGGGGGNGRSGDWKTQQRMATRRDNRPHPYGGAGGGENYFY